jgi:TolA-binding protein
MKYTLAIALLLAVSAAGAQGRDYQVKDDHKTRQIEQLQQLKQVINRKIDSLQVQLPQLASCMEDNRKKIEQLKKETAGSHRQPTAADQGTKLSFALATAANQADSLRKTFDIRINALDKTLMLQKDLEDKISALIKESNR